MHIACEHPLRLGDRDVGLANLAMALAVNPMLREAGFDLPPDAPLDPQFDDMAWEQIYDILAQQQTPSTDGNQADQADGSSLQGDAGQPSANPDPGQGDRLGDGGPQVDSTSSTASYGAEVRPLLEESGAPALPATIRDVETETSIMLVQARQAARRAGTLGGDIERLVKTIIQPRTRWTDVLRRFIRDQARAGYSWSRPNRKHAWRGVILPSPRSQNLGEIVVAVDTSASFRDEELAIAAAETGAIFAELRPKAVTVIYADSKVTRTRRFEAFDRFDLQPVGGGGTRFQPVFDWVDEYLAAPPACLIYFTDMQPFDDPEDPGYPVLWAAIGQDHKKIGFGETLPLG